MENIINEMKRTAKKENDRARKLWGSFGSHGYGRSFVLPPKAEKIQLMLKENKTRKQISKIIKDFSTQNKTKNVYKEISHFQIQIYDVLI